MDMFLTRAGEPTTEILQDEYALRRLGLAIEQAGEIVVITDSEGVIQYVNPAFETVTGYKRMEAVGQNPRLLKSGVHNPEFYQRLWRTISSGRVWNGRLVNRRKNGSQYTEQATISPVRDDHGDIINYVGVKSDISEYLAMQEKLQETGKLETIGQLAGGIAHDFNNQLAAVLGYADLLVAKLTDPGLRQYAERIKIAARRSAEMTNKLLAFSRQGQYELMPINIHRAIHDAISRINAELKQNVRISLKLHAQRLYVKGDPEQIRDIFLQLSLNAIEAMPDGGSLTISTTTGRLDCEVAGVVHNEEAQAPDYIIIKTEDTGKGMDDDIRQRLFEPFFTTKPLAVSAGMGLAAVYGIIKQHVGAIAVQSAPGQGALFTVFLPLAADVAENSGSNLTPAALRVLIIDDQEQVHKLGATLLRAVGHQVMTAGGGRQGLEMYREHWQDIDLVIFDMTMPGMSGRELFPLLKQINPEIRAVLASGYGLDAELQKTMRQGVRTFLHKPFTLNELLSAVSLAMA